MKHKITDKDIIAYHEAGHAVVGWALKVRFSHISVHDFGGKVTGTAINEYSWNPDFMSTSDWTLIEKKALILLAGEAAERGYNELRGEDVHDEYLSVHDLRELNELLERFGPHTCPPIDMSEKALRVKTDELIGEHWHRIEALAKELVKNGEMSGHQAIRIIESSKLIPSISG